MSSLPIWRQVLQPFDKWLSLPNLDVVEVVAATVVANRLPGEPLWLALVGPSSSGKTEVVRALETVRNIEQVDQFSTATLVSGFRLGRPRKGAPSVLPEYGLLTKHMDGEPFIITINDFSTVFGKRPETRTEIMNQLRRLYDGAYDAPFGTGISISWRGKCGVIACSTGIYDRESSAQSIFGDRFLVYRTLAGDPIQVAERASRNAPKTDEMRHELRQGMRKLDKIPLPGEPVKLSLDARTLISKLCTFVCRARTPVPRDTFRHELQSTPEIEGTGRISAELHQLLRGLITFKGRLEVYEDDIKLIERVAFGTIPTLRARVFQEMDIKLGSTMNELQDFTGIPRSVLHRLLQDLQLLDLIEWRSNVKPPSARSGRYFPVEQWKPFMFHVQQAQLDP